MDNEQNWLKRSLKDAVNICVENYTSNVDNDDATLGFGKFFSEIFKITKFTYPLILFWDITAECNSRCNHCLHLKSGFFDKKTHDLTTEQIYKIIDEIHDLNIFVLTISGGEPMLREDIYDILSYIKKRNISICLQTNGINMTNEVILKLKDILDPDLDSIQVSLDASSHKTYKNIRGTDSYDKVIDAIRNLVNHGFRTIVYCVAVTHNLYELPDIFKLCGDLGVSMFMFSRFIPFDPSQRYLIPYEEILFKAEAEIINLSKNYPNMHYASSVHGAAQFYYWVNYLDYLNLEPTETAENNEIATNDEIIENNNELDKIYSFYPYTSISINPQGLVYPPSCCYFDSNEFIMGDLKEESLKDIWDRRFNSGVFQITDSHLTEDCKNCDYLALCKKGFTAMLLSEEIIKNKAGAPCKSHIKCQFES